MLLTQFHSATGSYKILGVFYVRLAPLLPLLMCIVLHQSLYQRAIPDMCGAENTSPLYEGKGKREVQDSYRPLSLTDCMQ